MLSLLMVAIGASVNAIQESSRFEVTNPASLASLWPNATVPNTPALFGEFAFGHTKSIQGLLYYANPPDDPEGCKDYTNDDLAQWPTEMGNLIVMVDRGDCTFVKKVLHLQAAGAIAAIIVDNKDEALLPYMADDRSGAQIFIPSLLIHKDDGAKFKTALDDPANKNEVNVKFTWNLPHPDNRVEWEFFTNSNNDDSEEFTQEFAPVAEMLGDSALMEPHFEFTDGKREYRCFNADPKQRYCYSQCTNQGRYCSFDPDGDLYVGLNGSHTVRENLRQRCLWMVLNETKQDFNIWWKYVQKFNDECATVESWGEQCSFAAMDELKLGGGSGAVQACITGGGGYGEEDEDNTIMDAEIALKYEDKIFSWPTITINKVPYRGDRSCPNKDADGNFDREGCNVLTAICTGFSKAPAICTQSNACPVGEIQDDCGVCGGTCFGCAVDACGSCMLPSDPEWNKKCEDCAGETNGLNTEDTDCKTCGNPPLGRDACGLCPESDVKRQMDPTKCAKPAKVSQKTVQGESDSFPTWATILIVIVVVGMFGGGVFVFMRRRERAMQHDIDSLLKQYLPMGAEGGDERASATGL